MTIGCCLVRKNKAGLLQDAALIKYKVAGSQILPFQEGSRY